MTDRYDPDIDDLYQTPSSWHTGPGSALHAFATTRVVAPSRPPQADEITRHMNDVEANHGHHPDAHGERDQLHELQTLGPHYHVGAQIDGGQPEKVTCHSDAAEALAAYLDLARSHADEDDEALVEHLIHTARGDEYSCGCGHHHTHCSVSDPPPCPHDCCDCAVYQPDFGDDGPAMRATVDAILTDDPPSLGGEHIMVVADADGWRWIFWLRLVTDAACDLQREQG